MPTTYTLISGTTLSSNQTNFSFTSIPQTYTDLAVRMSLRGNTGNQTAAFEMTINGVASGYGYTILKNESGGISSTRGNADSRFYLNDAVPQQFTTANTFASYEIYFPNYTTTATKPLSYYSVLENNSTVNNYINLMAGLNTSTAAITSIQFNNNTFITGSSFYLYGIKNS